MFRMTESVSAGLLVLLFAVSATAQSLNADASAEQPPQASITRSVASLAAASSELEPRRPKALPMLYASLIAVQMADGYMTQWGLSHGAIEVNPLQQRVVNHPTAAWTMKATAIAVPILVAEGSWRKNRTAAIASIVLANAVSSLVAWHNIRVVQALH